LEEKSKGKEVFFFEKKKQKTFNLNPAVSFGCRDARERIFNLWLRPRPAPGGAEGSIVGHEGISPAPD